MAAVLAALDMAAERRGPAAAQRAISRAAPPAQAGSFSWREADRTLIVGDAFVTTAQESACAVAGQRAEMHGPPMYCTVEWDKAAESVTRLAQLEPEIVITGHGLPMRAPGMRAALHRLAREFGSIAVPENGRYLRTPARPEDGSAYCDPST